MRTFWLILYYGLAKHLPKSIVPIIGTIAKHLRRACAEHLFAECGPLINVEQGAYFGNGKQIHVLGEKVGLGKNFTCHCRILTMHSHIMMAEDVLFQGGGHGYDNPDVRMDEAEGLPPTPLEICEDVWIGARAMILPGCILHIHVIKHGYLFILSKKCLKLKTYVEQKSKQKRNLTVCFHL